MPQSEPAAPPDRRNDVSPTTILDLTRAAWILPVLLSAGLILGPLVIVTALWTALKRAWDWAGMVERRATRPTGDPLVTTARLFLHPPDREFSIAAAMVFAALVAMTVIAIVLIPDGLADLANSTPNRPNPRLSALSDAFVIAVFVYALVVSASGELAEGWCSRDRVRAWVWLIDLITVAAAAADVAIWLPHRQVAWPDGALVGAAVMAVEDLLVLVLVSQAPVGHDQQTPPANPAELPA